MCVHSLALIQHKCHHITPFYRQWVVYRYQTHLLLPNPLFLTPLLAYCASSPFLPTSAEERHLYFVICTCLHVSVECAYMWRSKFVCSGWKGEEGGVVFCTLMGCRETWLSAWSWERRSLWGVGLQTKETHTHWHWITGAKGAADSWGASLSTQQTIHNSSTSCFFFFVCWKTLGKRGLMCLPALWIPFWAEKCLCWSSSYHLQPVVFRSVWVSMFGMEKWGWHNKQLCS